jgi:hypothetical protein
VSLTSAVQGSAVFAPAVVFGRAVRKEDTFSLIPYSGSSKAGGDSDADGKNSVRSDDSAHQYGEFS